jgi:hypothetical protein
MVARKTRRVNKSKGLFRRVYSPIHHLIEATRNVARSTLRRGSRVADNVLGLAGNVGSAVAKHANATVRNVVRGRKNRKSKKTRKSRR